MRIKMMVATLAVATVAVGCGSSTTKTVTVASAPAPSTSQAPAPATTEVSPADARLSSASISRMKKAANATQPPWDLMNAKWSTCYPDDATVPSVSACVTKLVDPVVAAINHLYKAVDNASGTLPEASKCRATVSDYAATIDSLSMAFSNEVDSITNNDEAAYVTANSAIASSKVAFTAARGRMRVACY